MRQNPDTYNIIEIQCMHSSDSARLFVDRIEYDQLRAENAELTEQLAAAEKEMNRCYKMLLSEPDTKGALFKAENILREALADASIAAQS